MAWHRNDCDVGPKIERSSVQFSAIVLPCQHSGQIAHTLLRSDGGDALHSADVAEIDSLLLADCSYV